MKHSSQVFQEEPEYPLIRLEPDVPLTQLAEDQRIRPVNPSEMMNWNTYSKLKNS